MHLVERLPLCMLATASTGLHAYLRLPSARDSARPVAWWVDVQPQAPGAIIFVLILGFRVGRSH